jgi:hypothetical protein
MSNKTKPVLSWGFCDEDEDTDYEGEWDRMTDALDAIIRKVNPSGEWHCEVKNFGWQRLNGTKDFKAVDGNALLRGILPKTQNSFHIFVEGKTIKVQNFHHDSPTGDEWYTCIPA